MQTLKVHEETMATKYDKVHEAFQLAVGAIPEDDMRFYVNDPDDEWYRSFPICEQRSTLVSNKLMLPLPMLAKVFVPNDSLWPLGVSWVQKARTFFNAIFRCLPQPVQERWLEQAPGDPWEIFFRPVNLQQGDNIRSTPYSYGDCLSLDRASELLSTYKVRQDDAGYWVAQLGWEEGTRRNEKQEVVVVPGEGQVDVRRKKGSAVVERVHRIAAWAAWGHPCNSFGAGYVKLLEESVEWPETKRVHRDSGWDCIEVAGHRCRNTWCVRGCHMQWQTRKQNFHDVL
jgi:hypothetical protein